MEPRICIDAADAAMTAFPAPLVVSPEVAAEKANAARAVLRRSSASFGEELAEQINIIRSNHQSEPEYELPPLKVVAELTSSAGGHSQQMAVNNFIAHCNPYTGSEPVGRMETAGYSADSAGESIAAGVASSSALIDALMASPGHQANLLSSDFREIGVSYTHDEADTANVERDLDQDCLMDTAGDGPFHYYWTINFGRRNGVFPLVINGEAYETDSIQVDLYVYGAGWAEEMRFKNDTGTWSGWEVYTSQKSWQLSAGAGVKVVTVELRQGGETRQASDTIVYTALFSDGFESADLSAWSSSAQ